MYLQVVYCHPLSNSYNHALLQSLLSGLERAGHRVRVSDLYRDHFDPVLSPEERAKYYQQPYLGGPSEYIDLLRTIDGIIFCFPTWWSSMPAMLKGYVDRVWAPGIAFQLDAKRGRLKPLLHHIKLFGVVTTYGTPWLITRFVLGDPGRHTMMRTLKSMCGPKTKSFYIAHYGMDRSTARSRQLFLERVRRTAAAV